ncbi:MULTISPECIES: phage portal protein [Streptomyces]|uniref:Phage capsid and scaffold n=1 Tax=Streptomyces venezuelae (strain ATCC 10712 / CBS 650.69 / DSM 40230 / JCM 4526 / NBRC 13096 / PD 04745) TaxID=953739 RepID=F2RL39_STRVP|nr:phage portal protein [Streptomyces venezuelae]APE21405.1 phage capsid protein [Streptomyces venezuelae]QER98793.1 phage portal protein [Streptomyces venezuelae ATCC 10712]CCA55428.1 Phage capsid and scaffold [Streptomyces venezuelae ATCC 10712]
MTIPTLPLVGLSDDEQQILTLLRTDLLAHRFKLEVLDAYFNGEQIIRDLGISIPPQLKTLHTVIGWPRVGVEALEQRLDLEAFRWADGSDSTELEEIAEANDLYDESSLAHLDALTYGHEYVTVGTADDDGAPPIITYESPLDMTLAWDARLRKPLYALRECQDRYDFGLTPDERLVTLYLPDQNIYAVQQGNDWEVIDRDEHGLGVVTVLRMANRQRTGDRVGKSEITPEVRSITDAACRRLMGIEVAAEFFGAPQRYILGASESAFQDAEGNAKSAWETYIGRVLALERDEDGDVPTVGAFTAHDPSGQTKIIDLYARIMSSQLSVPPHMLGYTSDNPASADAIRSAEGALVKKAERRIRRFGATHKATMQLALWVRDGEQPDPSRRIETVWRNPATPTIAAQTDAAVKMVAAGLLPADSEVALEMAGLTEDQRERVAAERRRAQGRQVLASLVGQGAEETAVPEAGDGEYDL